MNDKKPSPAQLQRRITLLEGQLVAEPAIRARDQDVEQFPVGARVRTPSGRTGTVIKHSGAESKRDHFMRVTVQFDGGRRHDLVTLQPHLLAECPGSAGKAGKIES